MKQPTKSFKSSHAAVSAIGVIAAVALLCGAVWAEKATDKIDVKTGSSTQQVSPSKQAAAQSVNPFQDMLRLQREMDQLVSDQPSVWSSFPWDRALKDETFLQQPDMDLHEQSGAYVVKMDLPGMDKSNINIEVNDNVLTVSAENRQSTEKKDGDKVLMQERSDGYISRSVMLPKAVDQANVTAEYKDGVLNITLPKLAKEQTSSRIPIK